MERKKVILIAIAVVAIVCVYFIFEFFIRGLDKEEVITNNEDYVVSDNSSNSDIDSEEKNGSENNNVSREDDGDLESSNGEISDEGASEKIYVYVTGEVNKSGVVVLNEGSRITDAIDAAGGVTPNADISKINLVYVLSDGVKLNIPSFNDLKENPDFEYIILGSGEGGLNSEDSISSDGASSASKTTTGSGGKTSGGGVNTPSKQKVNINSASQTELELLPRYRPFTCS